MTSSTNDVDDDDSSNKHTHTHTHQNALVYSSVLTAARTGRGPPATIVECHACWLTTASRFSITHAAVSIMHIQNTQYVLKIRHYCESLKYKPRSHTSVYTRRYLNRRSLWWPLNYTGDRVLCPHPRPSPQCHPIPELQPHSLVNLNFQRQRNTDIIQHTANILSRLHAQILPLLIS